MAAGGKTTINQKEMVFTCIKQEILVPKELPAGDVLGNRNTNEITSLSFNYTVSDQNDSRCKIKII